MNLETRASKHPIEQPPQPLDRLSLDLQNPERSSSLEAPRALTCHWSSRLSCPRATTRSRATTISEIVIPGTNSDQDHHQQIDRLPIYLVRWKNLHRRNNSPPRAGESAGDNVHAPRAAASFEAQNGGFPAPIQETGTMFRLLRGRSTIWRWKRLHRRPHAPPRAGEAPATSPRASMQKHVRGACGHAPGTCQCHVSPRCAAASVLIATSACHISMPRGKKKKKRGKFW